MELQSLLEVVLASAQNGQFVTLAVAASLLVVGAVRYVAAKAPGLKFLAWVGTKWGGWALNLVASIGTAALSMVMSGATGASAYLMMAVSAVITALANAGVIELGKDAKA